MGRKLSSFCRLGNKLYFIKNDKVTPDYAVIQHMEQGNTTITDEHRTYEYLLFGRLAYAETGDLLRDLPYYKYITQLQLYMTCDKPLKVEVMYDGVNIPGHTATVSPPASGLIRIPLPARRCTSIRLRLGTQGNFKLYSLALSVEKGGDFL